MAAGRSMRSDNSKAMINLYFSGRINNIPCKIKFCSHINLCTLPTATVPYEETGMATQSLLRYQEA